VTCILTVLFECHIVTLCIVLASPNVSLNLCRVPATIHYVCWSVTDCGPFLMVLGACLDTYTLPEDPPINHFQNAWLLQQVCWFSCSSFYVNMWLAFLGTPKCTSIHLEGSALGKYCTNSINSSHPWPVTPQNFVDFRPPVTRDRRIDWIGTVRHFQGLLWLTLLSWLVQTQR